MLFEGGARVETSPVYAFAYDPNNYPAHWPYTGRYQFSKHYYSIVGELESSGEEFECAQAIDRCYQVKHWVRNLAQQPNFAFRLLLANGYFYPDFVCSSKTGALWPWNIREPTWKSTRWKNATPASCGKTRARAKPYFYGP